MASCEQGARRPAEDPLLGLTAAEGCAACDGACSLQATQRRHERWFEAV
jgi:hypothetical protein